MANVTSDRANAAHGQSERATGPRQPLERNGSLPFSAGDGILARRVDEPHFRGCLGRTRSRGDASRWNWTCHTIAGNKTRTALSELVRRALVAIHVDRRRQENAQLSLISWALERHRHEPESWKSYEDFMGFSPAPAMLICCGPGHRGDGGIGPAAPPFAGCRRTVLNPLIRLARVPRGNMPRDQQHGESKFRADQPDQCNPAPQCKSLPLLARAL